MAGNRDTVLVVGPGPVDLGQGCGLQYMAARACWLLRKRGRKVLVLEDNPSTLLDLGGEEEDLYMEPAVPEVVENIVKQRGAGSLWCGLGGRKGCMLSLRMSDEGWYERLGLRPQGGEDRIIRLCGNRSLLRGALKREGLPNPAFESVASLSEGQEAAERIAFPVAVRPHFSSGGWGAGIAYNQEEYPLLLEDAMRESPGGEVVIEEALLGWKKYMVLAMRDERGNQAVAGIVEQLEPLPRHEEDAVLIYPAPGAGGDDCALVSFTHEVMECLELLGLIEIKLAVSPDWRRLHVIDINPQAWRTLPLLEIATGRDLLSLHLALSSGGNIGETWPHIKGASRSEVLVAVPASYRSSGVSGEGYEGLGCGGAGRRVFVGGDAAEAVGAALEALEAATARDMGGEEDAEQAIRLLRDLVAGLGGNRAFMEDVGGRKVKVRCLSRTVGDGLEDATIFFSGNDPGPGGGFEGEVNCIRAMEAWRKEEGKAVLCTPNPFMALLGAELADAVFVGLPGEEHLLECAEATGAKRVALHFGGTPALGDMERMRLFGLTILGMDHAQRARDTLKVLEELKSAGLPVVKCEVSEGTGAGEEVLGRVTFPVQATCGIGTAEEKGRLVYAQEDGLDFLRENPSERVLWREIKEEALEVQVEAVAHADGNHLVLLWEQLDEAGICNADGLGVYPPFYVTSEQKRMASALAVKAIDVLGIRGNLSMRMFLCNGDAVIYDLKAGASANLPFISRASSVSLAACGILALTGRKIAVEPRANGCTAVRAPLIPFREIAGMDILPSPRRRSTGAVMGMATGSDIAVAKALWSEGLMLRPGGRVFLSVANREKRRAVLLGRELREAGYVLMATRGTSHALASSGIEVETVNKLREGRPNILDYIRNGDIDMVVNVPRGKHPHSDGFYIRAASARHGIPCVTNMEVALALARGLREAIPHHWEVRPLIEYASVSHEVGGQ